jgi:hypothetical protein
VAVAESNVAFEMRVYSGGTFPAVAILAAIWALALGGIASPQPQPRAGCVPVPSDILSALAERLPAGARIDSAKMVWDGHWFTGGDKWSVSARLVTSRGAVTYVSWSLLYDTAEDGGSSQLVSAALGSASLKCVQATTNPSVSPHADSGVAWTPAQVWAALESKPLISVRPMSFHVLGPATSAGDAFQPTKVTALTTFGPATTVDGKRAWRYFNVVARVAVTGVVGDRVASFCLHPTSVVRTVYPFSTFRLTGLDLGFSVGRLPCRDA